MKENGNCAWSEKGIHVVAVDAHRRRPRRPAVVKRFYMQLSAAAKPLSLRVFEFCAAKNPLFPRQHHRSQRRASRAISAVFQGCKNRTAWFEPLSQLHRYGNSCPIAPTPLIHLSFGDDKHNQTFQTRVFDLFGELKPTLHVSLILKTTSLMRYAFLRENLRLTRNSAASLHTHLRHALHRAPLC